MSIKTADRSKIEDLIFEIEGLKLDISNKKIIAELENTTTRLNDLLELR